MLSGFGGIIDSFRRDPGGTAVTMLYTAVCVLLSLILHECAHGYAALKCGDPTAKWMGRLTLDPRKHLDPLGTVCMLFLRIGWAKPVPINPRNFRHYRRDYILVSLAGIAVNLLLCLLSLVVSALLARAIWHPDVLRSLQDKSLFLNVYTNSPAVFVYGGLFSAFTQDALRSPWLLYVQRFFLMFAQMNLGLAVFNFLPVPPLDGYRFLDEFVFYGRLHMDARTMQIIQIVFLVICFSGVLSGLLSTVNGAVFGVLSRVISVLI